MSLYISGIPSDRINEVWEDCEPYIEMGNGKSRDEMSVMDIYKRLSEARMQLWLVFDDNREIISVLTTEIIEYPRNTPTIPPRLDHKFSNPKSLVLVVSKYCDPRS